MDKWVRGAGLDAIRRRVACGVGTRPLPRTSFHSVPGQVASRIPRHGMHRIRSVPRLLSARAVLIENGRGEVQK